MIFADRLDEDGYLWEALEEDPSVERESSVPFKLIPYAGKVKTSPSVQGCFSLGAWKRGSIMGSGRGAVMVHTQLARVCSWWGPSGHESSRAEIGVTKHTVCYTARSSERRCKAHVPTLPPHMSSSPVNVPTMNQ